MHFASPSGILTEYEHAPVHHLQSVDREWPDPRQGKKSPKKTELGDICGPLGGHWVSTKRVAYTFHWLVMERV